VLHPPWADAIAKLQIILKREIRLFVFCLRNNKIFCGKGCELPALTISLSIARQTKQLPEYTTVKGLERDKIKQMALQFIQNAGEDGAKKNSLLDYLKEVLPQRNSQEQNLRLLGNILSEMNTEGSVVLRGKLWFVCK